MTSIKKERDSWLKEYKKYFRNRKIIKIPHTYISWSKRMTCISLRSGFWLSNIIWCKYAFFYTYSKIHISHLVGRMKRKANIKSLWWGSYTSERLSESFEELNFIFLHKLSKPSERMSVKEQMISIFVNHSILRPPKNWRRQKSPTGNEIIKGWIEYQFIQIKEETLS